MRRDDEEEMPAMPFQDEHREMDEWRQTLLGFQRASMFLAHGFCLAAMMIVSAWVANAGGLQWEKGFSTCIFNWHPLMMITAFLFMTVASLSFRYRGMGTKVLSKIVHGVSWAVAMLCMMVGLIAVFRSHNDEQSGFIANLYSMHSWMGLFVLTVYIMQFLAGVFTFGFPLRFATPSFKAKMLLLHQFFGPVIYLAMLLVILLGIQEKEGFHGCSYEVTKADLTPWRNISKIPSFCLLGHLLGFLVLLTGVCTCFALHPLDRGSFRQN